MKLPAIKYKSTFTPPYDKAGKPVFSHAVFSKMAGVYLIKKGAAVVYVGHSRYNLYKTLYRHFQTWNHSQEPVVTYAGRMKDIKVRIFVTSHTAVQKWEKYFINKYKDLDNITRPKYYKEDKDAEPFFKEAYANADQEAPF